MVFAKRAAMEIGENIAGVAFDDERAQVDVSAYEDLDKIKEEYKKIVLDEIERETQSHE